MLKHAKATAYSFQCWNTRTAGRHSWNLDRFKRYFISMKHFHCVYILLFISDSCRLPVCCMQ